LLLDGATHAQNDYPELFAVLDDGLKDGTDFTLPDTTEAYAFGVVVKSDAGHVEGSNTLSLTVGQLPSHNHSYVPPVLSATAETPVVPVPSVAVGGSTSTGNAGDGDDIDKRPKRFGLIFAVFAGRT
jgi:microcystin-dependent protein